ncbi:MAG: tetratricopeptide repeat protein [Acidobacteriota bacterium]|nr:tetratricopeptide repeat protein [Blastocatellia bacterium]MDW8413703.1 tetratricopeptide repeat protein [Acidobacteriota bacterium]
MRRVYSSCNRRFLVLVFVLVAVSGVFAQAVKSSDDKARRYNPTSSTFAVRFVPASSTVSAVRFNPLERSQRYGVQQVGEAVAQATRLARPTRPRLSAAEILVAKADKLIDSEDYLAALSVYRQAVDTDPKLASARLGLGIALLEIGDFEAAEKEFLEALILAPKDAESRLNLGVALYRSGRIDAAIVQYQQALQINPNLAAAYFNLGMAYAHLGDFEKALTNYQVAVRKRKLYAEAYNNMGIIYEAMGQLEVARKHFEQAIAQRQNYALAWYNLARLYFDEGKYQEAEAQFQQAVKLRPVFAEAYLELGNLYLIRATTMNTPEMNRAVEAYRRAIELRKGEYPLAHENLAIALTKLGHREQAFAEYRQAFEQNEGRSADTLRNLVSTILGRGSFLIGNELKRSDNPGNLKSKKEPLATTREQLEKAVGEYYEAEDSFKDNADIRYCGGLAFLALGDIYSAIEEFAAAVELSSGRDKAAEKALDTLIEAILYF